MLIFPYANDRSLSTLPRRRRTYRRRGRVALCHSNGTKCRRSNVSKPHQPCHVHLRSPRCRQMATRHFPAYAGSCPLGPVHSVAEMSLVPPVQTACLNDCRRYGEEFQQHNWEADLWATAALCHYPSGRGAATDTVLDSRHVTYVLLLQIIHKTGPISLVDNAVSCEPVLITVQTFDRPAHSC